MFNCRDMRRPDWALGWLDPRDGIFAGSDSSHPPDQDQQ